MGEEKKIRKAFPQFIVDQVYIKQDGVCGKDSCFNPLANGFHRHHDDGDPSNIKMENCKLFCIECHFATFGEDENPLEEHRKLQRTIMNGIAKHLGDSLEGRITGSTLERVLAGYAQALSLSWKEKGLNVKIEYPSPTFTMLRQMMKDGIVQDAYLEGYKDGVNIGREVRSN